MSTYSAIRMLAASLMAVIANAHANATEFTRIFEKLAVLEAEVAKLKLENAEIKATRSTVGEIKMFGTCPPGWIESEAHPQLGIVNDPGHNHGISGGGSFLNA